MFLFQVKAFGQKTDEKSLREIIAKKLQMKRTKSKRKVFDIYVLTLSQGYPHKASWYDGDHDINLPLHARNNIIIIVYTLFASNASLWPMIWS